MINKRNRFFLVAVASFVHFVLFSQATEAGLSIVTENALEGTNRWWIKQFNSTPVAQGFTTKFSFSIGDVVRFKITSPSIESFHLGIFRLGYYGGMGGRLLTNMSVASQVQPACNFELSSRMTDCSNWRVSAEWTIPHDAYTGIYVAVPVYINPQTHRESYGSYIPFVVRQPKSKVGSDILFKTSDLTWVAYNKYGNWNVYRGNGSFSPDSRAFKASYDRPWQNRSLPPEGQYSNFLFGSEFSMLFWLEKQGYDVSYASCQDVEDMHAESVLVPQTTPGSAQKPSPFKAMLSVGHDEYWTPALKAAYEAARENGVSLAFFSGNEVYWRVQWDEETHAAKANLRYHTKPPTSSKLRGGGGNSQPLQIYHNKATMLDAHTSEVLILENRRIVVCRKETINNTAPIAADDWTGTFRDPRHRVPEEESRLTGQWFMVNAHRKDSMEITREDATLRLWRNASFASYGERRYRDTAGDCVVRKPSKRHARGDDVVHTTPPGVLGYEWDVYPTATEVRPVGLFPLSTTRMHLHKHLVQDYGARYKGSGPATHRLSLYRHHHQRTRHPPTPTSTATRTHESVCKLKHELKQDAVLSREGEYTPSTSLVFGAGTIQWSWALSAWHDGFPMAEDRDLQQATLNLLADMGALPATLRDLVTNKTCSVESLPLVSPSLPTDTSPPRSSIMHIEIKTTPSVPLAPLQPPGSATALHTSATATPGHMIDPRNNRSHHPHYPAPDEAAALESRGRTLRVRGRAEDDGGGAVAAVEVSVDAGKTWHLASGRKRWHYTHHFADHVSLERIHRRAPEKDVFSKFRDTLVGKRILYGHRGLVNGTSIVVMSRAIDDSGWMEDLHTNTLTALCSVEDPRNNQTTLFAIGQNASDDMVRVTSNTIIVNLIQ